MTITSLQNIRVKELIRLRESRYRRASKQFIVEGSREISRALSANFKCKKLFVCSEIFDRNTEDNATVFSSCSEIISVSENVFAKMAIREGSGGLLAVFEDPERSLEEIALSQNPLFLVLDGIEKPGNAGALIRTADGVNADAVIFLGTNLDIFNPITIRSSIGAIFSRQPIQCTHQEFMEFCLKHSITVVAASPFAQKFHFDMDLSSPFALIVGSEADGLSPFWQDSSYQKLKIPMLGKSDSLNASVAGAVILYEALRQRVKQH